MSIRLPVVYKGKHYMPMRLARAKRLEIEGKCKIKYDTKLGISYIHLKYKPSGKEIQQINLGIDPGSHFDGFTLLSKKCHLANFQLNHNKTVKSRMESRSMYRRIRRSRLRSRKARYDSRTKKKLVPTIRSMFEYRKWMLNKLAYYYPIDMVIVEDVKYNHFNDRTGYYGSSFSQVEVGKTELYQFIRSNFNQLHTIRGWLTKNARIKLFGTPDPKLKNKGANNFYAHCVDSYTIAHYQLGEVDHKLYKRCNIITKNLFVRRELFKCKLLRVDKVNKVKPVKGGSFVELTEKDTPGRPKIRWVQQKQKNFKDFDLLINGIKPKDYSHKLELLKSEDFRESKHLKYSYFRYGGTTTKSTDFDKNGWPEYITKKFKEIPLFTVSKKMVFKFSKDNTRCMFTKSRDIQNYFKWLISNMNNKYNKNSYKLVGYKNQLITAVR